MAFVKAADITSYVDTIYEDALLVARENNIMAGLVASFSASGTATRSRSEYGTVTINQITDVDDLSSQALTPSVQNSLTPYEYGAQFFLTDTRVESDRFGVAADASLELGQGLGEAIDKNLLGNFSSLTGGTVGAAGTTITWGHVAAMHTELRTQKAPGPYYCVLHPRQWHNLGKTIAQGSTVTNAPELLMNEVNRAFYVGHAMGVAFFTTANISVDGDGDGYCALFSRQALALDWRRMPRVEPERDASRRGYELNLSAIYAHGVWRPKWGVQGIFDASVASS